MLKYPNGWRELQVIRTKDGMTLQGLARLSGISVGHLSDLESGRRRPTLPVMKTLSVTLRVPMSVLAPSPELDVDDIADRVDKGRGDDSEERAA